MILLVLLLVAALGIAHALEPDHIVTLRLMKGVKSYVFFSVSHGLGFALIALPLTLAFSFYRQAEIIGDVIALAFAVLLIYGEIRGVEIEVSPRGSGVLQGAFAVTPSKVAIAIIASEQGLLIGAISIGLFILTSTIFIILVGVLLTFIPSRVEKYINISLGFITIIFVLLQTLI